MKEIKDINKWEAYTMFMIWKNKYCQNRHNPNQSTVSIKSL